MDVHKRIWQMKKINSYLSVLNNEVTVLTEIQSMQIITEHISQSNGNRN